jgi:hypothetical protein
MTRVLFTVELMVGCILVACSSSAAAPVPTVSPDQQIIFHNGMILTMDEAMPVAEAVAITGEMITAVGSNTDILAQQQTGTIVVDLNGRILMPGFVDAHTHLFNDAEQFFDMSLAEVQQIALQNGITTIGDMYVDERFLHEIEDFAPALRIRTSLYLVMTDNCGKTLGDWYREHPITRNPGEMLRIGGVKIFADGGTCQRPALSYELTAGGGLGDLFHTQAALDEMVLAAQNGGYQVAIHLSGVWASLRIDSEGEQSSLTTERRNSARASKSSMSATSTWLMLVIPAVEVITWGPAICTSRSRLAAFPVTASPTPTASIRAPPALASFASWIARFMVVAFASPRFVLTPTSGGGPASNGSPG